MKSYLRSAIKVPFQSLYLDPNSPRLAPDHPPGYEDSERLFEKELQTFLEKRVEEEFGVDELLQAVIGQGWIPIDAIVVWEHPDGSQRNVVLEGNRRTVTLRRIRDRLPKERAKLERMRSGKSRVAPRELKTQEELIAQLARIVAETETIMVLPLDAADYKELEIKMPRVLAVRHITGAKPWGNYAEDLWLLQRYEQLFAEELPGKELRWEPAVITRVADEASLSAVAARRQLMTQSAYSHFKSRFAEELQTEKRSPLPTTTFSRTL